MSDYPSLKAYANKIFSRSNKKIKPTLVGSKYYIAHDEDRIFEWKVQHCEATTLENQVRQWTHYFPPLIDNESIDCFKLNLQVLDETGRAKLLYEFSPWKKLKRKYTHTNVRLLIFQVLRNKSRKLLTCDYGPIKNNQVRITHELVLLEYDPIKYKEMHFVCSVTLTAPDLMSHLTGHALSNTSLSDFTIKCGENEYKTHKIILAMRSKYFMEMFEKGGLEAATGNILKIDDIEPELMDKLIRYIYTDEIDIVGSGMKFIFGLVKVAHRYKLNCLVEQCEYELVKKLDIDNVILFVELSQKYGLFNLKNRAILLICENGKNGGNVLNSSEWKQLIKSDPAFVSEVFEAMIKTQKTVSG